MIAIICCPINTALKVLGQEAITSNRGWCKSITSGKLTTITRCLKIHDRTARIDIITRLLQSWLTMRFTLQKNKRLSSMITINWLSTYEDLTIQTILALPTRLEMIRLRETICERVKRSTIFRLRSGRACAPHNLADERRINTPKACSVPVYHIGKCRTKDLEHLQTRLALFKVYRQDQSSLQVATSSLTSGKETTKWKFLMMMSRLTLWKRSRKWSDRSMNQSSQMIL